MAQPSPYRTEFVILGPISRAQLAWLSFYGPALHDVGGYTLAGHANHTLTYTRTWTPVAAWLCCILLFPLGYSRSLLGVDLC